MRVSPRTRTRGPRRCGRAPAPCASARRSSGGLGGPKLVGRLCGPVAFEFRIACSDRSRDQTPTRRFFGCAGFFKTESTTRNPHRAHSYTFRLAVLTTVVVSCMYCNSRVAVICDMLFSFSAKFEVSRRAAHRVRVFGEAMADPRDRACTRYGLVNQANLPNI